MKNEVIFVSGQRGSGKTYWVKHFIRGQGRYLLYDALSEYENAPRFTDIGALLEFSKAHAGEGFFEAIYDPLEHEDFPLFCRIALVLRGLYVVVEEIDLFATPYMAPSELQKLIKYGRHYGVNVLGVSRRPSEVSRLFTSQATRFVLFRQIEPRDITYFRSIIGPQAERLPDLPPYHFLDIDFSRGFPLPSDPQKLPPP
jgi:hypothetical protein